MVCRQESRTLFFFFSFTFGGRQGKGHSTHCKGGVAKKPRRIGRGIRVSTAARPGNDRKGGGDD